MSQDTFSLKEVSSKRGRGRPSQKNKAGVSTLILKGDIADAFRAVKDQYDAQMPFTTDNHQFMLVLLDTFQRSEV